jgi:hypothetical protein
MYPSGAWRGYWEQPGWGRQTMDSLYLVFVNGTIEGEGRDVVGSFTFTGTYDTEGHVTLTKRYRGRHSVLYRGTYDGEGTIFGQWTISPYWSGRFALRAVAEMDVTEEPIYEIKPAPVPV